jgi:hypothetical protein
MRKILLTIVSLALCSALLAQQALNNEAIIKLVKAGLSDDFILSMIGTQPGKYDASTEAIIALKNAGASDRVMTAIVQKVTGSAPADPSSATPPPGPAPTEKPTPQPVVAAPEPATATQTNPKAESPLPSTSSIAAWSSPEPESSSRRWGDSKPTSQPPFVKRAFR